MPGRTIEQRNIALYIILSIITCGIFGLYWLYTLVEDMNTLKGDPNATSGGIVVLLSIVTCSIYLIYWMYTAGQAIDDVSVREGNAPGSRGILYLVLAIFGLNIINYALIQNELNHRATVI